MANGIECHQPRQHLPTVAAFTNRGRIHQPWQHLATVAAFTNRGSIYQQRHRGSIYQPCQHLPTVAAFTDCGSICRRGVGLSSQLSPRSPYLPPVHKHVSFVSANTGTPSPYDWITRTHDGHRNPWKTSFRAELKKQLDTNWTDVQRNALSALTTTNRPRKSRFLLTC